MEKADIGVIGLGVMGQMLALNMDRNGFRVAGYDLDAAKVAKLSQRSEQRIASCSDLATFVALLERPRRILMMVPAGKPVIDAVVSLLLHA